MSQGYIKLVSSFLLVAGMSNATVAQAGKNGHATRPFHPDVFVNLKDTELFND